MYTTLIVKAQAVPWNPASGGMQAAQGNCTIRAIVRAATVPTGTILLDNDVFQQMVIHGDKEESNMASVAIGALACFLESIAKRCEDALRPERKHVISKGGRDRTDGPQLPTLGYLSHGAFRQYELRLFRFSTSIEAREVELSYSPALVFEKG